MQTYDERLIAEFVKRTRHLSHQEAGELIGVSHETVRRYRAGETHALRASNRSVMASYLNLRPEPDIDGYHQGLEYAADELEKLVERLRRMSSPEQG